MRSFVALELSEEARAEIRRRIGRLRATLPPARWVEAESMHLTLVFLGEVAEERLRTVTTALAPVFARRSPLPLRLHGGGTFPPARPARVAWVGIKAPAALLDLQREVAAAAAGAGVEVDGRPWHPHVTVARCRAPWPRRVVERFAQEVSHGVWGESWEVTEGVLFESRLSPRGARHEPRAVFPLAGAA